MFQAKHSLKVLSFSALVLSGAMLVSAPSFAFKAAGDSVSVASLKMDVAQDSHEAGAKNFIGSMTERGINFLADKKLTHDQRQAEFKKLLQDSFDMKTIARFAIGKYWRSASNAQQKEYLKLFEKMIVDVYSRRFSEYGGQELNVVDARSEGKSDIMVTTEVVSEGSPTVNVDWRVRYKDGRYKVIDIMVEGVSMALTHRSDFSSVIQRGGGDIEVLLDHLRNS